MTAKQNLLRLTCTAGHVRNVDETPYLWGWHYDERDDVRKATLYTCPVCGASETSARKKIVVRQTANPKTCDDSCRFAKGDTCACTCKGEDHGIRR